MLKNEPTLAIAAVDTEENERLRFWVIHSVYSFHSLTFSPSRQPATAQAAAQLAAWLQGTGGWTELRTNSVTYTWNRNKNLQTQILDAKGSLGLCQKK